MAHIEIENLTFSYPSAGRPSLSDVSLTIRRGEYVVLCGKSGSGKTTLLRHLKSVLAPHGKRSGDIRINGVSLKDMSQRDQAAKVGFVMQNPDDQIVTDKVWHELAFGLESLGCDQKTMRARVAEMACYFGIQDWFHRDVANLSGGQKQLLNLASIMAMQPEILILDEPTSQLDPIAASDFLNTLRKINAELGTTILITEHRVEDIFPYADRAIVMDGGKVIANDTPRNIGKRLWEERYVYRHAHAGAGVLRQRRGGGVPPDRAGGQKLAQRYFPEPAGNHRASGTATDRRRRRNRPFTERTVVPL